MASRAILRRRKSFVHNYFNGSASSILSFHSPVRSIGTQSPSHSNCSNGISPYKDDRFKLSPDLRQYVYGFTNSSLHDCFSRSNASIGVRWMSSQSSSAAAAAKPDEPDNEGNDEAVAKKRKEASPEECDQAVEGLTTAKAKAKAKRSQESPRDVQSVFKRVWAVFLGIGPALRAVASMSRSASFTFILFCLISCRN